MIIYYSMIIWIVLLTILYNTTKPTELLRTGEEVVPLPFAVLAMGYVVFWVGIRSRGMDTPAYISAFKTAPTGIDSMFRLIAEGTKDWGFYSLGILWKTIVSENYHSWLMLIAVCTGVPIMKTLRRRSPDFMWSMLLFILMQHFTWMMNGIRQFLATALIFGSCHLIEERKMVRFFVVVFLCSLIHKTALIMIPIYFFCIEEPFTKRMWLFILGILSLSFAVAPMVEVMGDVLQGSQYESNLKQFAEDDGVHPLRVALMAMPPILAYIRRERIAELEDSFLNICVNMSVITCGLYFIGMLTSGIMIGRLPIYCELYNLILLPYLVKEVYDDMSKLVYWTATIVYALFFHVLFNYYYASDLTGIII